MSRMLLKLFFICIVFLCKKCVCAKNNANSVAWPFEEELAAFPEYINQSEPVGKYQCTAELEEYDLLAWYQMNESKHILLSVIQNVDKLSNMTVTLDKTFEESDRDAVFFCVKEHSQKIVRWIAISFHSGYIAPKIEPAVVSTDPSYSFIYFDTDKTLRFVCRGTKPLDGRRLTWYFENYTESTETNEVVSHFEIPEHQEYDSNDNDNVLELSVNSDCNLKRLFCAEDFYRTIRNGDGTNKIIRFGQRAKSKTITLIHRSLRTFSPSSHNSDTVVVALALLLIIFIMSVTLVIVIVKHKRRVEAFEAKERMWNRKPLEIPNENTYAAVYSHGAGLLRKPF